jgi:hypothetical protein
LEYICLLAIVYRLLTSLLKLVNSITLNDLPVFEMDDKQQLGEENNIDKVGAHCPERKMHIDLILRNKVTTMLVGLMVLD